MPNESVSGKYLACTINGTELDGLHDWEADDGGTPELDRTAGKDRGYTNRDVGPFDLVVRLRLYFILGVSNTIPIQTGTIITDLALFRDVDDAVPAYFLPEAIVTSKPSRAAVAGRLEVDATVKNRGPFEEDGVGG